MRRFFIRFNNFLTRTRRVKVAGKNLLLLAPHCLQNSGCEFNVTKNIESCRRCGKCDMRGLLEIRDKYGLLCVAAGGGRQALAQVKRPDVKAVVAVACEQELVDGIRASFPRPVLAVINQRPHGPCKDTTVDVAEVEQAVLSLLR